MKKITLFIGLLAMLLIIVAGYQGGTQTVFRGLKYSIKTFIMVSPLLLCAFGITGLLQGMLKKETIKKLLGREAGIKAIMLGAIAGAIMPSLRSLLRVIKSSWLNFAMPMFIKVFPSFWENRLPNKMACRICSKS